MKLPIRTGIGIVYKAVEKQRDQKLWEMWLMKYQYMEQENFVPFSLFKQQHNLKISKRSKEEILNEADEIRKGLGR